jgi:hypothetical protein
MTKKDIHPSRREFVKKAAYVAPAILTLAVAPSYAKAGSEKEERRKELVEKVQSFFDWWRQRR